jgi:tRNA G37 N-methylase Trm5
VLRRLGADRRMSVWAAVAQALGAARLGVQGCIEESLHRKSTARLLWPEGCTDGWTVQRESGIFYGLDVTRSMFSSGNGTEKARVASFHCASEVVVDLYAGIGYFTLPFLVHAAAKHLHACEWDEDALVALRHNLAANGVADRCTVHPGDNAAAAIALAGVAHRVNLGLIPSSEAGWPVAIAVLRPEGGMLHVHANVGSSTEEEEAWKARLVERLEALAADAGRSGWRARALHLEVVKSYAPRLNHVVADVRMGAVAEASAEGVL